MAFRETVRRLCVVVLVAGVVTSCAYLPRSTMVPVKVIEEGISPAKELVVFLPGRWSTVEEFRREGILGIAAERWPEAKLVVPDLHLGYYKNQTVVERLHEDVIQPAIEAGAAKVTLVGVSLGGLGAVIYDLRHPGVVDQIILLAPFLGEEEVVAEIGSAGGLDGWEPGRIDDKDFSRKIWTGLKESWGKQKKAPKVVLGCGEDDRLMVGSRVFADEFLEERDEFWIPGAHDWPVWRELFQAMVNGRSDL